ncbi:hypothetical protein CC85DRAFT_35175 [Cutaneotrichosporon oleaginosum]|uniref:Uncharacterized protein n=1 Tax=Cutaneotrichosporon oleaginosum TaxID=879819 RepID=A0A0J0XS91_9TREE|nr:uncharacterized protein CC85DRAFT_35175 [Cutaneotrichosporon oleaginosum]KLT43931.1 hypothetical protein CC85DRAFT_35175 [Cutaneotrichosporon oleaginosum]TXT04122.1 hypothetical protein COLE_07819 [Cutaneotrichosporon oleaginosum]
MLESDPPPAYAPRRPRDLALPGRRHFPAWLADDGFAGTKPLAETWYQRVVERTHADPRVVYEAAEPRLLSPGALCSKRVYFLEFGWCGGTMQRGALVRAWRALLAAHDVLSRARCDVCAIVDELEPPPAAAQSVATDTTLAPTPAEKTPLSDLRKRKAALFVHPFHGLAAVISALEGAISESPLALTSDDGPGLVRPRRA